MSDPSFENKPLTQLEYGELDEEGEVTAWHLIQLQADGAADLSQIPAGMRDKWTNFGISLPMMSKAIFPRDGQDFLRALLQTAGPYRRLRIPSASVV